MSEFIEPIWDIIFRNVLDPLFVHWPTTSGVAGFLIVVIGIVIKWRAYEVGFKRISVEIHYRFSARDAITFESLSTIKVTRANLKEYSTAIDGGRAKPHVVSRDPNMHVVVDEHSSGEVKKMVVHFDTDVPKGEIDIPLIGDFTDPKMTENPRMPFRLNTHLKQLIIAVHLPDNEKIKAAYAEVSRGTVTLRKRKIHIWKNNLFVHVFQNVKPNLTYALTWQYDDATNSPAGDIRPH